MSDYLLSEFATICRLCLKKDGVMSCIFNNVMDNGEFDPLATRITDFFHIQVSALIIHKCFIDLFAIFLRHMMMAGVRAD